jgi:hypothetical protein
MTAAWFTKSRLLETARIIPEIAASAKRGRGLTTAIVIVSSSNAVRRIHEFISDDSELTSPAAPLNTAKVSAMPPPRREDRPDRDAREAAPLGHLMGDRRGRGRRERLQQSKAGHVLPKWERKPASFISWFRQRWLPRSTSPPLLNCRSLQVITMV